MSHQSSNVSSYLQHQKELLVEDYAEENEQAEAQNRMVPPMYTSLPTSLCLPPAMSPVTSDANFCLQHLQEMLVEGFQELNVQPETPYPRSRSPIDRSCALNEKGLPLRPGKDVCPHYKRFRLCKYGPACRFDHPENEVQVQKVPMYTPLQTSVCLPPAMSPVASDANFCLQHQQEMLVEEFQEQNVQPEPPYRRSRSPIDRSCALNEKGLPLRPGKDVCPHYKRFRLCKYGPACRFDHPENVVQVQKHQQEMLVEEFQEQNVQPQPPYARSRSPIDRSCTLNEKGLPLRPGKDVCPHYKRFRLCKYGPACRFDHPENVVQAHKVPMYTPLQTSVCLPPAMSPVASDANFCLQHQQEMLVEEFQEQNVQPEPPYPRSRSPIDRSCALNEKGLPLRPGKDVCPHYKRFRLCKYGPACRFDHPENIVQVAK